MSADETLDSVPKMKPYRVADVERMARLVLDSHAEIERLQAEKGAERRETADDIIRDYYKERRRNPRMTLRKYLQNRGCPEREGYIRKRKVAYDKAKRRRSRGNTQQ